MCKKLMFLISLVALLSLANVGYAADINWDGGGTTESICEAANWDGDVMPGASDNAWSDGTLSTKTMLIDCDIDVTGWYAPLYTSAATGISQTMNMVSGNLTASHRWQGIQQNIISGYINVTGGTITVTDTGEKRCRFGNDAVSGTYGELNFGGNALVDIAGAMRIGNGGGLWLLNCYGDSQLNVGLLGDPGKDYLRLGDPGGGELRFSGNTDVEVGGDLNLLGADGDQELTVSGNAQIYTYGGVNLAQNQVSGTPPVHVDMTMTGGTVNCAFLAVAHGFPGQIVTLDMSGGEITVRGALLVPGMGPDATVTLSGDAVIRCASLSLTANGSIDIEDDAQLIITGNVLSQVFSLRDAGLLTACGGQAPLKADYNVTTPLKTTVWCDSTIEPCAAWSPTPADTATEVDQTIGLLEWRIGADMSSIPGDNFHYIFLSDDEGCVTDADCGSLGSAEACSRGWERGDPNHDISDLSLDLWTTYYWRVDEHYTSCCKGYVWNFTTGCALVAADVNMDCLVNFEDYALLAGDWMEEDLWP